MIPGVALGVGEFECGRGGRPASPVVTFGTVVAEAEKLVPVGIFVAEAKRDGIAQLVYKHAISTIMPSQMVHFSGEEPQDDTSKERSK